MSAFSGIELNTENLEFFLEPSALEQREEEITIIDMELNAGLGPGSDFLGWVDLPSMMLKYGLTQLTEIAQETRENSDLVIVIGIGGSYLGAKAALSALEDSLSGPEIAFAGTDLSSTGLKRLAKRAEDRDLRLVVISKSGTTLEPGIAFRYFRNLLEKRYGDQAARRITAITDQSRGALRALADDQGYTSLVIPDDVGGRFSVLTPVGLLPLAIAGLDIRAMLEGAALMAEFTRTPVLQENPAHLYAAARTALYQAGYRTEVMSSFNPDLQYTQEWWKQLFGESEGKEGKGIFPASTVFTTDLHSLGQYIQDGRRELFETFLTVDDVSPDVVVPLDAAADDQPDRDRDSLGFLAGTAIDWINQQAYLGTRKAHTAGGVPNMTIGLKTMDARTLGGLFYLFQKAVAVSGRLLDVNPFDQPGVEAYKREMFNLLKKS
jgi:glucose-6-phosphate isomerase